MQDENGMPGGGGCTSTAPTSLPTVATPLPHYRCYQKDPRTRMSCTIELGDGVKMSDLDLAQFHKYIAAPLWANGVICIKGQQGVGPRGLIAATAMLGTPIRLPTQLAFNNRDATFPEITRVGNINNDNAKMENFFDAKYWHTDGSFWPRGKQFVTNWLQTVVRPSQGGNTAFIDMQEVYAQHLSDADRARYDRTRFVVRHRNLFAPPLVKENPTARKKKTDGLADATAGPPPPLGVCPSSEAAQCGIPVSAIHETVYPHPITGVPSLYVGTSNSFMVRPGDDGREGDKCSLPCIDSVDPSAVPIRSDDRADKIIADFAAKATIYTHVWEDGDVLVWDNAQTMHRGVGGIAASDHRLLFRTQSQVTEEYVDAHRVMMALWKA